MNQVARCKRDPVCLPLLLGVVGLHFGVAVVDVSEHGYIVLTLRVHCAAEHLRLGVVTLHRSCAGSPKSG